MARSSLPGGARPVAAAQAGRRRGGARRPVAERGETSMNGWLVWGLVLPVLLVVAGLVDRRRRRRRAAAPGSGRQRPPRGARQGSRRDHRR
ncbi:LPXTG cell wall anchor domain-containing protein [Blastococcus sp. SYSU D00695]